MPYAYKTMVKSYIDSQNRFVLSIPYTIYFALSSTIYFRFVFLALCDGWCALCAYGTRQTTYDYDISNSISEFINTPGECAEFWWAEVEFFRFEIWILQQLVHIDYLNMSAIVGCGRFNLLFFIFFLPPNFKFFDSIRFSIVFTIAKWQIYLNELECELFERMNETEKTISNFDSDSDSD